jgi:hypothetical protein
MHAYFGPARSGGAPIPGAVEIDMDEVLLIDDSDVEVELEIVQAINAPPSTVKRLLVRMHIIFDRSGSLVLSLIIPRPDYTVNGSGIYGIITD